MAANMSDCPFDYYWYCTYYLGAMAADASRRSRRASHTATLLAPVLTILCSVFVCVSVTVHNHFGPHMSCN